MNLLQKGEATHQGRNVYQTRAETMLQPRQPIQFRHAVDVSGVFVEHG